MSGHVLIVDRDPARGQRLREELLAARYEASLSGDGRPAAAERRCDLLILDLGDDDAALALLPWRITLGKVAPAIALVPPGRDDLRLAALAAGADDVVERDAGAGLLQARIRSLLRARDSVAPRDEDGLPPGLSEAPAAFDGPLPSAPARIALLSPAPDEMGLDLPGLGRHVVAAASPAELDAAPAPEIDVALLDGGAASADLASGAQVLSWLVELRGRDATRHAMTLVLLPPGGEALAALALDLGAEDVMVGPPRPEELSVRIRALLGRKSAADRRRSEIEARLEEAVRDSVTGLHNRHHAERALARMLGQVRVTGKSLALLLVDIDHFKEVNDRWGHGVGDHVLAETAGLLRGALRERDLLARWGGDEFLVALPEMGAEQARAMGHRLREEVAGRVLATAPRFGPRAAAWADRLHGDAGLCEGCPEAVGVTLSIGICIVTAGDVAQGLRLSDLLVRADRSLYSAKGAGRNRVAIDMAAS